MDNVDLKKYFLRQQHFQNGQSLMFITKIYDTFLHEIIEIIKVKHKLKI